jgi:hypothetical protein
MGKHRITGWIEMAEKPGQDDYDPQYDWSWTDERDEWVPPPVDLSKPSAARMYDYCLGGKDNRTVDREAVERVELLLPDMRELCRANRSFLVHAVRRCTALGVDQFIDLGTGIPTSPNVHEVARETFPDAKIVYVDNDPVVLSHNRALLAKDPNVLALLRDVRNPDEILNEPQVRALLDFDRPIAVLMVAVLHFVSHDLAPEIVARFRDALPSGSLIAISVGTTEGIDPQVTERVQAVYRNSTAPTVGLSRAQIERLFEGFELEEEGLVDARAWRTDSKPVTTTALCGIARRP